MHPEVGLTHWETPRISLHFFTVFNIETFGKFQRLNFIQREIYRVVTTVFARPTGKDDKVYLQCFDADELKRIKNELEPKMGMDLNLVQLIAYTDWNETQQKQPDGSWVNYNYDWMFKPGAMKQVAEYADGIGPDYHMLIEETSQPGNIKLTGMVQDAQQNKLVVHPYTVRSDKLPEYTTDVNQLYDALYNKAGVNGLFTDFPDKAVKFLNKE